MINEKELAVLNQGQRWVILLSKYDADNFDETDFHIVSKDISTYSDEYCFLLIESLIEDSDYRPDDILCLTGALAVHEEWSNAIIVPSREVEDIYSDLYPWEGSGNVLIGDMLTDLEKMNYLLLYLYTEHKELIEIKNIQVKKGKDDDYIPLDENTTLLFGDKLYGAKYKENDIVFWWPILLEESGLYIIVLDEDLDEDDEDEDTETAKYLNYPWGSYDDYDYRDDYYRRF